MKRLLVCGSRDFPFKDAVIDKLNYEIMIHNDLLIITGMARGPDTWAYEFAQEYGIPYEAYYAQWKTQGKAAGIIRNKRMLEEGKPTHILACMYNNSRGTRNMIELGRSNNIPVEILT